MPRFLQTAAAVALAGLSVSSIGCGTATDSVPGPGPSQPPPSPPLPRLGPFVPDAPLPAPRYNAAAATVGGFIYVVGGQPAADTGMSATTTVFVSRILSDGSLQGWMETSSLNDPRVESGLVAWVPPAGPRYLMAIGGRLAPTSVERAFILPDGSLSTWERLDPLPRPWTGWTVAQTADRVFLFGGFRPGTDDTTLSAPLSMTGPGQWSEGPRLPRGWFGGSALVQGNHIYLAAGIFSGGGWAAETFVASLDGSGGIASWAQGAPHLLARYGGALFADGRDGLIVVGGIGRAAITESLEHSATDAAGTMLGWRGLGELPLPTGGMASVKAQGHIYILGGMVHVRPTIITDYVWRASLD